MMEPPIHRLNTTHDENPHLSGLVCPFAGGIYLIGEAWSIPQWEGLVFFGDILGVTLSFFIPFVVVRWVVERTNAWHTWGFKKLLICAERRARVIDAMISFTNSIIVLRRLIREAWYTQRWDAPPKRKP